MTDGGQVGKELIGVESHVVEAQWDGYPSATAENLLKKFKFSHPSSVPSNISYTFSFKWFGSWFFHYSRNPLQQEGQGIVAGY